MSGEGRGVAVNVAVRSWKSFNLIMISDVTESLTYCSVVSSYKETCCSITNYYFCSDCVENMKNLLESVLKPLLEKSDQLKPLICGQRPLNHL